MIKAILLLAVLGLIAWMLFRPRRTPEQRALTEARAVLGVGLRAEADAQHHRDEADQPPRATPAMPARRARSASLQPPSGPIRTAHGPLGSPASVCAGPTSASSAHRMRRALSHPSSSRASGVSSATWGTKVPPHCSAASTAWACSRPWAMRSALV